jgi:hypothetical protein
MIIVMMITIVMMIGSKPMLTIMIYRQQYSIPVGEVTMRVKISR